MHARIARLNPSLKSFCYVAPDAAAQAARASEARWQAHRKTGAPVGELDGVPASIKDLILTRGWPTLRGSRTVDPAQPWDVDAPVVARLREAGAVLLGKTGDARIRLQGRDQFAAHRHHAQPVESGEDTGRFFGRHAPRRWRRAWGRWRSAPTARAAIRIPAAFCGNFGLKPSFGRVPAYPLSPFGTVAHLGPHTMSVHDAALMMNVLKRPDARDWTSLPADADATTPSAWTTACAACASRTRRRLVTRRTCDPEIAAAVDAAVRELDALGAQVEHVDPGFDDPLDITTGLWFVGAWTVWNTLTPEQQA